MALGWAGARERLVSESGRTGSTALGPDQTGAAKGQLLAEASTAQQSRAIKQ